MKLIKPALFLLIITISFSSCLKDECDATRTYVRYDPVYLQAAQLRKAIEMTEPRALENPGKIYYYQDFLLINELNEGIHFFLAVVLGDKTYVSSLGLPENLASNN